MECVLSPTTAARTRSIQLSLPLVPQFSEEASLAPCSSAPGVSAAQPLSGTPLGSHRPSSHGLPLTVSASQAPGQYNWSPAPLNVPRPASGTQP